MIVKLKTYLRTYGFQSVEQSVKFFNCTNASEEKIPQNIAYKGLYGSYFHVTSGLQLNS